MDVFDLRNKLVRDYSSYISSFINIGDARIGEHVNRQLRQGVLWPDPLIQLNPTFEPGERIDELVEQGQLHPTASRIFRLNKQSRAEPNGRPLRLHKHQSDAVYAARSGDNYVLTTGTGSGKSLSYIVPIVDHVLRRGSGKGIQAVIVYPMNALANSQKNELDKFLRNGFTRPPVTYRRYTGQESEDERKEIIDNPPDIILTNYVMLELILTRPREKALVRAMRGLQFLVLDELHTYRGRQGADVAMLVRRLRNLSENGRLQVVGTSATLAEGGTFAAQREAIARVATQLFGAEVKPERVIGETLRRITPDRALDDPAFVQQLAERVQGNTPPPEGFEAFCQDPLSIWIETMFGLETEPESGRLRRAKPLSITADDGAAVRLAALTGTSLDQCEQVIQRTLLAGYQAEHPETGFPVFAFRLHQFISRGDTVYASLENSNEREITLKGQQFVPGDRSRVLLPLAFCRECGHEYYVVKRVVDNDGHTQFVPRELRDQTREEDEDRGFLYRNLAAPWPDDIEQQIEHDLLPADWLEPTRSGGLRVKRYHRSKLPQTLQVGTNGREDPNGHTYQFVKTPFAFCLNCGVAYGSRERSDFAKLATLSSEGRSTATTVLSLSALTHLRSEEMLDAKARKLLSFTDNRQDASLQAGHFNDFVEVGLLRAALYEAASKAERDGLQHDELAQAVFDTLALEPELYATNPDAKYAAQKNTAAALRDVLAYRLYQDLRRGWRITSPNLEQVGLLHIAYPGLDELCNDEPEWQTLHPALAAARPDTRNAICKTLLDYLRRELAIRVDYLNPDYQERIQQRSSQRLVDPWAIDENETMTHAAVAWPRPRGKGREYRGDVFVSSRGGFGTYLRRNGTLPELEERLNTAEAETVIRDLFKVLVVGGHLEVVREGKDDDVPGYQLAADAMIWLAGDGSTPFHDPIRMPRPSSQGSRANPFFVDYYKEAARNLAGTSAREHTAQVPLEERIKREDEFRKAKLPILYCSPTMELGVDISQLNVVNMRNVPPTPANYAQRSGRAGRSGQPALVFTYCTTGSPHDQYFFKRPDQMVAGAVAPPRLELANEELLRAHVHAVWLAEAELELGRSLRDVLDLSDETHLPLLDAVKQSATSMSARRNALARLETIFESLRPDLEAADWYHDDWLLKQVQQVDRAFNEACNRWRSLYRAARRQQDAQHAIILDPSRTPKDKEMAKRLRREAESQIVLLTDNSGRIAQSDFYSYRYFASEGFLPGYNFPRLPLSAFIPARRRSVQSQDEFLSRSRFLAISEFGPQSIVYHEGSKYVINKVILPVDDSRDSSGVPTSSVKLCAVCGYLHPMQSESEGPDLCEHCGHSLGAALPSLFRMQNVATRRRDRINSDEEERMRMGYELKTAVRFGELEGKRNYRTAVVTTPDGTPLLTLTYGDAATLWRINLGWRRRKDESPPGFMLDIERGYWQKNEMELESDPDDPMSPRMQRVIPYVEDRRNCLIIQPAEPMSPEKLASLQPALKSAIQVLYRLEDNELAAEPLPDRDQRQQILLYESSEGGAGVLRRLLDDTDAIAAVATQALELCHFDANGRDLRHAPNASEACEAACYDCLMSYYNQMDHLMLDRQLIRDFLLELANSRLQASPRPITRREHLERLMRHTESSLERDWLDFLEQHGFHLPDEAQKLLKACSTRADFWYAERQTAVFIDGPKHDLDDVSANDQRITDCLEFDLGITAVRFHYLSDWAAIAADHPDIFGKGTE